MAVFGFVERDTMFATSSNDFTAFPPIYLHDWDSLFAAVYAISRGFHRVEVSVETDTGFQQFYQGSARQFLKAEHLAFQSASARYRLLGGDPI